MRKTVQLCLRTNSSSWLPLIFFMKHSCTGTVQWIKAKVHLPCCHNLINFGKVTLLRHYHGVWLWFSVLLYWEQRTLAKSFRKESASQILAHGFMYQKESLKIKSWECPWYSSWTGPEYVPVHWSFKPTDSKGFPVCFENGNTNERAEGQVSANWRWPEDFNDEAFPSRFWFFFFWNACLNYISLGNNVVDC